MADAIHALFVAKANDDMAEAAKAKTRELLNKAVLKAAKSGVSKAEIGRIIETSGQRVSQIISTLESD